MYFYLIYNVFYFKFIRIIYIYINELLIYLFLLIYKNLFDYNDYFIKFFFITTVSFYFKFL